MFLSIRVVSALILITASGLAHSRDWQRIRIPGARCGDGQEYAVFYEKKDASKLTVELMGGGACWSAKTCYAPTPLTWVYPMPKLPIYGQFSSSASVASEHSYLYFPYCTGDVHAGQHIARYPGAPAVYHYGYLNVVRALKFLADNHVVPFHQVRDVIFFGASAGAIGSLAHASNLDKYIPTGAKRTLIADAPGLHFGKDFWKKLEISSFKF